MPAERLIDDLVAGLRPGPRRSVRRDALMLALVGAAEIGLFLLLGALRPDIMAAMAKPVFWWKLASFGLLAIVSCVTAVRSFEPTGSPRRGLRAASLLVGVALAIGWAVDAAAPGEGTLLARLVWREGVRCVAAMMILSAPAILALGLLMRRGAPTDPRGSALAVGIAGAAWGAFVFLFSCPHDDPFYVAVWYGLGCAMVALAGRLLLPLLIRW